MSDKKLGLSRRQMLAGLGTIGVASAGAGIGTTALFSDEESFEDNSLTAGQLNLVVDYWTDANSEAIADGTTGSGENDGGVSAQYVLNDVKPGDDGSLVFCPRVVDNPAWMWAGSGGITDYENGQTDPEAAVDDSAGGNLGTPNDGAGAGELSENIQVTASYCESSVSEPEGPDDFEKIRELNNPDDYTLADLVHDLQTGFLLDGDDVEDGETDPYPGSDDSDDQQGPCICIDWVVPSDVGNEIQSDSVEFDIQFYAEQARNNDDPDNPFCTELSLDLEEQYQQLLNTTLPDPYTLEIEVVDENGDPFTGEITEDDHGNDQFLWVTDHLGEFDETPENRYGDYAQLDFADDGTARILLGNDDDADVSYLGLDVNEITENIEVNVGEAIEGLELVGMCVITDPQ